MSDRTLPGDLSRLPAQGLVVLGFSGGADSTALAHWLTTQIAPARLLLAHVNHGLRGAEADADEAAVAAFAEAMGLRFVVHRSDVAALAKERGEGLEAAGRRVRYAFFESLAPGEDDRILTAHTADDNAETLLLHLCRGSGLGGLCGIPPERGKILRPFLSVTRAEIEAYCAAHRLPFVTDSTNTTALYARNRLRQEVLPILKELYPGAVPAMGRAAALLREDAALLDGEAAALLEKAAHPEGLSVKLLLAAPAPLRRRALKAWLEAQGCRDLEHRHLLLAEDLLTQGGKVPLPGGVTLRRSRGLLRAGPTPRSIPEKFTN